MNKEKFEDETCAMDGEEIKEQIKGFLIIILLFGGVIASLLLLLYILGLICFGLISLI